MKSVDLSLLLMVIVFIVFQSAEAMPRPLPVALPHPVAKPSVAGEAILATGDVISTVGDAVRDVRDEVAHFFGGILSGI
ncbi:uncharacterized protein [Palaemon carinicauda]|uniref:uncharacterized protein isoform X2 n=1 Tax=Palaemon carinicauda TaxID=392227 RepID=UPI0035B60212